MFIYFIHLCMLLPYIEAYLYVYVWIILYYTFM